MIPKYIKVLFCIPIVIILCYSVYLLSVYSSVPEIIPIHSYGGRKDEYGSKVFLFLPVVLNLIILIFTWLIIRRPDKIKFTFEINENDRGKNLSYHPDDFSNSFHICHNHDESFIIF